MMPITIHVRLTPKASRNAITGWAEGANGQRFLKASVTAVPEKGKANDALIALLAKTWGIPKSSIVIERGATDRVKTLILQQAPEKWQEISQSSL